MKGKDRAVRTDWVDQKTRHQIYDVKWLPS